MIRHTDGLSDFSSQNIETIIVLLIEVLTPHHCSHLCIIINHFQFLSIFILVIVKVDNIVCSTTLVLFACLVQVNSGSESVHFLLLVLFHVFPSLLLSLKSFFSQMTKFSMLLIHVGLSHFLIKHCKIFVKPFSFYRSI